MAGLTAWAALGESFGWFKLLGATVALSGVAIAQFANPPRAPIPETGALV